MKRVASFRNPFPIIWEDAYMIGRFFGAVTGDFACWLRRDATTATGRGPPRGQAFAEDRDRRLSKRRRLLRPGRCQSLRNVAAAPGLAFTFRSYFDTDC